MGKLGLLLDSTAVVHDFEGPAGPLPAGWTVRSGTWGLDGLGNATVTASPADKNTATTTAPSPYSSVTAILTLAPGANAWWDIVLRWVDAANYCGIEITDGGQLLIYKRVAGVNTTLNTVTPPTPFVAGDVVRVDWIGNAIQVSRAGVVIATSAAINDAAIQSSANVGMLLGYVNGGVVRKWGDFRIDPPGPAHAAGPGKSAEDTFTRADVAQFAGSKTEIGNATWENRGAASDWSISAGQAANAFGGVIGVYLPTTPEDPIFIEEDIKWDAAAPGFSFHGGNTGAGAYEIGLQLLTTSVRVFNITAGSYNFWAQGEVTVPTFTVGEVVKCRMEISAARIVRTFVRGAEIGAPYQMTAAEITTLRERMSYFSLRTDNTSAARWDNFKAGLLVPTPASAEAFAAFGIPL